MLESKRLLMDSGSIVMIDLLLKYIRRSDPIAVVRILEGATSRGELTKWLNQVVNAELWGKLLLLIDTSTLKFIYDRAKHKEEMK